MASKRKSLCIYEKVLLIRAIEAGEKITDVSKRFGLNRSTVYTIWKNKIKILQAEEDGKSSKKLKRPKYEALDQGILTWFNQQRQNNMPISGPIVRAKAEKLAVELGLTSFKSSEGWHSKFKQRHHIEYGKISRRKHSVDTNVTHDWINVGLCTNFMSDEVKTEPEFDGKEDKMEEPEPPPSIEEALKAAELLEKYFLHHQDASMSQDMNKLSKKIQQNSWYSNGYQANTIDCTQ